MRINRLFCVSMVGFLGLQTAANAQKLVNTTVYYNATIFTSNPKQPTVAAIAVAGDRIIAVGALKKVKKIAGKNAQLYDLQGKFLMSGMVDSHLHGVGRGPFLTKAHLGDRLLSLADLAIYAEKNRLNGKAMYGDCMKITGLNLNYWTDAATLSQIFDGGVYATIPVAFRGMDGHTGWGNKAMMVRAGITPSFIQQLPSNVQSLYGHDASFMPDGLVREAAMDRLMTFIPKLDPQESLLAGHEVIRYLNRVGLTTITDLACDDDLPLYRQLSNAQKLTMRVAAFPLAYPDKNHDEQLNYVKDLQKNYADIPHITIPGIKIFADGVAEFPAQTAVLSKPYLNSGLTGELEFNPADFAKISIAADRAGLIVHVHAIGDRAITETLNGFEQVRKTNGNSGLPHTITHLQFVLPSDHTRFKELGVAASFQLFWAVADTVYTRLVAPYIDASIYQWQYPARSIFEKGALIAGASDWPVSTANPFEAIYCAETRRGETPITLNLNEAMPREAMLYAYTINAAKAIRLDHEVGSLEVGKKADLILLDRNVLKVSAAEMKATKVIWTMMDGQVIYSLGTGDEQ